MYSTQGGCENAQKTNEEGLVAVTRSIVPGRETLPRSTVDGITTDVEKRSPYPCSSVWTRGKLLEWYFVDPTSWYSVYTHDTEVFTLIKYTKRLQYVSVEEQFQASLVYRLPIQITRSQYHMCTTAHYALVLTH